MTDITFKTECLMLRHQGLTLNEIIGVTQRPKTSVYFHIKNTPLGDEKKREIVRASAQRITTFNHKRKGKSVRGFQTFDTWSTLTVFLCAHLMFDGEINYAGCVYNNRNYVLINRVKKCFSEIYNFSPIEYTADDGVHRISYHNVALAAYLKQKAAQLLQEIVSLPAILQKTFLIAFFDDEGCASFEPSRNKRRIRGYQHNRVTLELIQRLLCNFGIESKMSGSIEIVVSGKENMNRFARVINFSPGVCINGNRSNSIWKKSLEKRDILKMAIASYKQRQRDGYKTIPSSYRSSTPCGYFVSQSLTKYLTRSCGSSASSRADRFSDEMR